MTFYHILVSVPVLVSFSLLFFLLFMLSARGQSVREYQQDIFMWNKDKVGLMMSQLDFNFTVNSNSFATSHRDETFAGEVASYDTLQEESVAELETTFSQIYYY